MKLIITINANMNTKSTFSRCKVKSIQFLAFIFLGSSLQAFEIEQTANSVKDASQWLFKEHENFYQNKDHPWIHSLSVDGRMHYQTAWLNGTDEYGHDFTDAYDEIRRLRIGSKMRFLNFLKASLDINLADDQRYLSGASDDLLKSIDEHDLEWGFQGFAEAVIEINLDKATEVSWLDEVSLSLGKMKLETGWERRQSSNEIYTIERSDLSNTLGGNDSRPVGILAEIDHKKWGAELGVFAGADETDLVGDWGGGVFTAVGATWRPQKGLEFAIQHIYAEPSAQDTALGYASATILETIYHDERWGFLADAVIGDNGSEQKNGRNGPFGGLVLMPWYWAMEDRLQVVLRYQFMESEEKEGLRMSSRYLRAGHEESLVDVNNGRGDQLHSIYAGVNYLISGDNLKLMAGFSFDRLSAPEGDVYARMLQLALRTSF